MQARRVFSGWRYPAHNTLPHIGFATAITAEDVEYGKVEQILTRIQGLSKDGKTGSPGSQPRSTSPPLLNPLPRPTRAQNVIFELINKKTTAMKHREVLDLGAEVVRQFQGINVLTLIRDLNTIGKAFAQANLDDPAAGSLRHRESGLGINLLDEAARATESDCWTLWMHYAASGRLLIGDPQQLQPQVETRSKQAKEAKLNGFASN